MTMRSGTYEPVERIWTPNNERVRWLQVELVFIEVVASAGTGREGAMRTCGSATDDSMGTTLEEGELSYIGACILAGEADFQRFPSRFLDYWQPEESEVRTSESEAEGNRS